MRKTGMNRKLLNPKEKLPLDSYMAVEPQYTTMKGKQLTVEQVIDFLKKQQGERTQREFAEEIGITSAYLSDLYLRRRDPAEKVLGKFGITRKTVYELKAS